MFYATKLITYCYTVWRSHVPPYAKLSKKNSNHFGKPIFNRVTLSLVPKKVSITVSSFGQRPIHSLHDRINYTDR
jgi:hypothetical protein